jgi:hypothetical protein
MTEEDLAAAIAPTIQRYVDGDLAPAKATRRTPTPIKRTRTRRGDEGWRAPASGVFSTTSVRDGL